MNQKSFKSRFLTLLVGCLLLGGAASSPALIINPIWDSSLTNNANAATIMTTINAAIAIYQANFNDAVTVSIQFNGTNTGLGGSSTFFASVGYAAYRTALAADASTAADAAAIASLPVQANNPVNGNASVRLSTANFRAIGFTNVFPGGGQPDSTISLNFGLMNLDRSSTNAAKYDLMAVVEHEIDEALGMGSALNNLTNNAPNPAGPALNEDMFRYGTNNVRSLSTALATQAFFSYDGGTNLLAQFNQTQGGDFSDFISNTNLIQVQDAFGTPGTQPSLGVELTILDVLGWNAAPVPEPGTMALLGLGALALLRFRKKK